MFYSLPTVDSFFTKLCSTPGQKAEISLSKYLAPERDDEDDTSIGGPISAELDSSIAHQKVCDNGVCNLSNI